MATHKLIATLAALAISALSQYVAGIRLIDPLLLRPTFFGLAIVVGILNWPLAEEFGAKGPKAVLL